MRLMTKLGQLAEEKDLAIQSHLNETPSEVEWVKELCPECKDYIETYTKAGLVRPYKTIMAHCIYLSLIHISLYLGSLLLGAVICLFFADSSEYEKPSEKKQPGAAVALTLMLFFFFAHKVIEVFYTYIDDASSVAALRGNSRARHW